MERRSFEFDWFEDNLNRRVSASSPSRSKYVFVFFLLCCFSPLAMLYVKYTRACQLGHVLPLL